MDTNLKKLIVEFLKHEDIVGSWGITNIRVRKTTVSFQVSGFKCKEKVHIRCQKEGYCVKIGKEKALLFDLSNIIKGIDDEIETTDDYFKKIALWVVNSKSK